MAARLSRPGKVVILGFAFPVLTAKTNIGVPRFRIAPMDGHFSPGTLP